MGRCVWTGRGSVLPSKLSNTLAVHHNGWPQAETKSVFPCPVSLYEKWKALYPLRSNAISNYLDVCWKYIRYVTQGLKKQSVAVLWPVWQKILMKSLILRLRFLPVPIMMVLVTSQDHNLLPHVENQLCMRWAEHPMQAKVTGNGWGRSPFDSELVSFHQFLCLQHFSLPYNKETLSFTLEQEQFCAWFTFPASWECKAISLCLKGQHKYKTNKQTALLILTLVKTDLMLFFKKSKY